MAHQSLRHLALTAAFMFAILPGLVRGAQPSDQLLPNTTKAYLAVANLDQVTEDWNRTQLGKLSQDPLMKPFADDLQRQLKAKFSQSGVRLGVTLDDLRGVASGEVAVASIQPNGDKARCATVLLADVSGRENQAQRLLDKVGGVLQEKGATAGVADIGGVRFTSFKLARKKPTDRPITAVYALHSGMLVATDDLEVAAHLVQHFSGTHQDTLSQVPAYQQAMQQTRQGFVKNPAVRWFVEPFGYVEIARAYQGGRRKRGTDRLKVLASQGFNAIQGVGGQVALATDQHDVQHQTFIYAPPVPGADADGSNERYKLAARMLDFPNTETLLPQTWIPSRLGTYLTFNWKLQKAFWSSETLVDELAGGEVFQEVLEQIEADPNGPRINLSTEFIRFLGERATLVSDYREPIDTKSERVLFAIEVSDQQSVMAAVNKVMSSDNAKKVVVDGHTIWEMIEDETFAVEEIKIDGAEVSTESEEVAEEETPRFRPNAAVTVANGHLLIASHVDYLVDLLKQPADADRLTAATDYQQMAGVLKQLGSSADCCRLFTRTNHAYRVTYEMLRQNRMPESESLLGKALNSMFAPEDEEELRENQLDGSKLPPFDDIKSYLGSTGLFVRSLPDGWVISGCLLAESK